MKVLIAFAVGLVALFAAVSAQECGGGQFTCDDGDCVPAHYECDGYKDCQDGTDEKNCTCDSDEFQCADGLCIPGDWVCDFYDDCDDGSDESADVECPTKGPCFECADGSDCVDGDWVCDKYNDCNDGSDEVDCPCNAGEVHCDDGRCISEEYWCDGQVWDCEDGSDELFCDNSTLPAVPQFHQPKPLSSKFLEKFIIKKNTLKAQRKAKKNL